MLTLRNVERYRPLAALAFTAPTTSGCILLRYLFQTWQHTLGGLKYGEIWNLGRENSAIMGKVCSEPDHRKVFVGRGVGNIRVDVLRSCGRIRFFEMTGLRRSETR